MDVVIAPQARRDIASILDWTERNFGTQTLRSYSRLIRTAIEQIAEKPDRAGSSQRPEITADCRIWHLENSRKTAGSAGARIRRPRHFILYRVTESNMVEIGRVLHDSMDLDSNLPEEFRRESH